MKYVNPNQINELESKLAGLESFVADPPFISLSGDSATGDYEISGELGVVGDVEISGDSFFINEDCLRISMGEPETYSKYIKASNKQSSPAGAIVESQKIWLGDKSISDNGTINAQSVSIFADSEERVSVNENILSLKKKIEIGEMVFEDFSEELSFGEETVIDTFSINDFVSKVYDLILYSRGSARNVCLTVSRGQNGFEMKEQISAYAPQASFSMSEENGQIYIFAESSFSVDSRVLVKGTKRGLRKPSIQESSMSSASSISSSWSSESSRSSSSMSSSSSSSRSSSSSSISSSSSGSSSSVSSSSSDSSISSVSSSSHSSLSSASSSSSSKSSSSSSQTSSSSMSSSYSSWSSFSSESSISSSQSSSSSSQSSSSKSSSSSSSNSSSSSYEAGTVCYYEPFDGAENKTFGAPQRQRLENNLVWWFNANAVIGDSSYGGKRVYSNSSSMEIIIESPIKDIWTISAEVRQDVGVNNPTTVCVYYSDDDMESWTLFDQIQVVSTHTTINIPMEIYGTYNIKIFSATSYSTRHFSFENIQICSVSDIMSSSSSSLSQSSSSSSHSSSQSSSQSSSSSANQIMYLGVFDSDNQEVDGFYYPAGLINGKTMYRNDDSDHIYWRGDVLRSWQMTVNSTGVALWSGDGDFPTGNAFWTYRVSTGIKVGIAYGGYVDYLQVSNSDNTGIDGDYLYSGEFNGRDWYSKDVDGTGYYEIYFAVDDTWVLSESPYLSQNIYARWSGDWPYPTGLPYWANESVASSGTEITAIYDLYET